MPIHLDDVGTMASKDPSGMLRQMASLPAQLKASLATEIDVKFDPDGVCICGLGGSAMGGDIICGHLDAVSTVPSAVSRDVRVPNWVDDTTLAIIISYSGNTRETMKMYAQARQRGAKIVAITSGGRLLTACQEDHVSVITVPQGYQPRAALGHLLGASAAVIESAGVAPLASDLREIVPALEARVEACLPQHGAAQNRAKDLAKQLYGKRPFIYSSQSIRSAGWRWMTQINENSKVLCTASELPEADHNQIVGWIDGLREKDNQPVILRAASEKGMAADIVRATISIFEDFHLGPIVVDLEGDSALENVMQGVVIGDFVSYYLAMLKGVDPVPVSSIAELKKRLG